MSITLATEAGRNKVQMLVLVLALYSSIGTSLDKNMPLPCVFQNIEVFKIVSVKRTYFKVFVLCGAIWTTLACSFDYKSASYPLTNTVNLHFPSKLTQLNAGWLTLAPSSATLNSSELFWCFVAQPPPTEKLVVERRELNRGKDEAPKGHETKILSLKMRE